MTPCGRSWLSFEWNELPERLRTAILKSTMVVTVSDLIGAARHGGLTSALVRLGQVLQRDDAALCGSPVQQNAVMVQALCKIALSDLTLHPNIVQKFNAVLHCAMTPQAPDTAFSTVLAMQSAQSAASPSSADWPMETAAMRVVQGYFSSAISATPYTFGFDEGAAIDVIRLDALQQAQQEIHAGHPPFLLDDERRPQLLVLKHAMRIVAFHGASAFAYAVARVHLVLGTAVYVRNLLVVNSAPHPVVLGLPFRSAFCRQMPASLRFVAEPLWEVAQMFLLVEPGTALRLPACLHHPAYEGKPLSECSFVQQLSLQTGWKSWRARGQLVPAAEAGTFMQKFFAHGA